jgi:hypothetical protein
MKNKKAAGRAGLLLTGFLLFFILSAVAEAVIVQITGGIPATHEAAIAASKDALRRSVTLMRTISTEGGYLYFYSLDLQKREWENKTTNLTEIAIQPPGTPAAGGAFLKAYTATRDPFYLDAARSVATALVRCQLPSGGWHYTADFDPARPNVDGAIYGETNKWVYGQFIKYEKATMFDDNTTQAAVKFLLDFYTQTANSENAEDLLIHQALYRALSDGMMGAQYPNGGWPQIYRGKQHSNTNYYNTDLYPIKNAVIPDEYPQVWPGKYSDFDYTFYYTQNDGCQSDCISVMFKAWDILGNPDYLASATNGIEFFLRAQLPPPQTAWAQQYNMNMEPAWARSQEVPAVCSAESGKAVLSLLDAYLRNTNEVRYLLAASNAVSWLESCHVGSNLWARLYDLKTGQPVYGDKSGTILTNPPPDSSYNWTDSYSLPQVINRYRRIADGTFPGTPSPVNLEKLRKSAVAAVLALDGEGRWIVSHCFKGEKEAEPAISVKEFVRNVNVLTEYLGHADPVK